MSKTKTFALWAVGIASLLAMGLAAYPWWPVIRDAFGADDYVSYLEANRIPLDLNLSEAGFSFPSEVYSSRFVMLGEVHGYATPQRIDLALIRHLNARAGVRWYLAEVAPAQAMAINTYLAGGDSVAAAAVFDGWADRTAQWANREFFDKLTAIRSMNTELPAERQVRFIGVDAPQGEARPPRPPTVTGDLDVIETADAINARLAVDAADAPAEWSRYDHILHNIESVLQTKGAEDETFYGLWGKFHTLKVPAQGAEPLALRLNAPDGLMPGGVTSIVTLCASNCFNMMPSAALPPPMQPSGREAYVWVPLGNDRTYFYRTAGVSDLLAAMGDDDEVLFPLGAEGTPYRTGVRLVGESGILAALQGLDVEGSAADAFDYVLGMRNTAPLTPWRGTAADVSGEAQALLNTE